MSVYVLGSDNRPLMPCSEKRARLLLERQRAYVVRMYPFMIKMKDRDQDNSELQDLEVKIDPGSKFTGFCLSRTEGTVVNVVDLIELEHRGRNISLNLTRRAMFRNHRRQRKTRYRQPRFDNRAKPKGWLPPSLRHRVETTMTWVTRLSKWSPVTMLAVERVKFDTQKMQNMNIQGKEYQQGTLAEYEVKEYLLEKYNRTCVYCDTQDGIYEKEHVHSVSQGGSNRISNLVLSCVPCNRKKGSLSVEVFLKHDPIRLAKIKAGLKKPLKDAAVMNATRNMLFKALLKTGLPVQVGTGAQTKWNRKLCNVPKTHTLDAACTGEVSQVNGWDIPTRLVKSIGRGRYSRTITDKYGFPDKYIRCPKLFEGFQTGDIVQTYARGFHGPIKFNGRIVIRNSGVFSALYGKTAINVMYKNCKLVQKADGYQYA